MNLKSTHVSDHGCTGHPTSLIGGIATAIALATKDGDDGAETW